MEIFPYEKTWIFKDEQHLRFLTSMKLFRMEFILVMILCCFRIIIFLWTSEEIHWLFSVFSLDTKSEHTLRSCVWVCMPSFKNLILLHLAKNMIRLMQDNNISNKWLPYWESTCTTKVPHFKQFRPWFIALKQPVNIKTKWNEITSTVTYRWKWSVRYKQNRTIWAAFRMSFLVIYFVEHF